MEKGTFIEFKFIEKSVVIGSPDKLFQVYIGV